MLRTKIVCFSPILLVSMSILIYQITDQHASRRSTSTHQAQSQNVQPILSEVAMINAGPAKAQDSTRLQVEESYGNLPLSFEPNRGQADPLVRFLSRAGNRTLWLTEDEAVLALGRASHSRSTPLTRAALSRGTGGGAVWAVKMHARDDARNGTIPIGRIQDQPLVSR